MDLAVTLGSDMWSWLHGVFGDSCNSLALSTIGLGGWDLEDNSIGR